MEPILIILGLSILANIVLGLMHLNKIKDADKNFIPDAIEDKAKQIKDEIKHRAKRIKEELGDVGAAIKEVGNQIGDLPDAAKGKTRKGRK
jgi:phage-related minor tail protein